MQIPNRALTAALVSLSIVPLHANAQQSRAAAHAVGVWAGQLAVGARRVRLQLTIRRDTAGAFAGIMKAIDQGGAELPATVDARGDSVSFAIPAQRVTYAGAMSANGDTIRGTFVQGQAFPLTFVRSDGPVASGRPQDPVPPFPYQTKEVTFESAPGVRLAGTLVVPPGAGPFPTVVFVTGSGPQDRDEAIAGHRPFLVIADYLARHGIASLRYDDRGTAKSTGNFVSSTSADFAADAEAAVHFVKGIPKLASTIGILGHSEGGLIGPMVATRTRDVGFLVLLAGPGVSGDSLTLLQIVAQASAVGAPIDRVNDALRVNRMLFEAVRGARDSTDAVRRLAAAERDMVAQLPPEKRDSASRVLAQSNARLLTPWMRFFLASNAPNTLRRVHVPVLALDGSLDTQVPAKQDLAGIKAALEAAGNRDYRVVELPGLNHLFQPATTGLAAEYVSIDQTIAPQVLELITSWINQHFASR